MTRRARRHSNGGEVVTQGYPSLVTLFPLQGNYPLGWNGMKWNEEVEDPE